MKLKSIFSLALAVVALSCGDISGNGYQAVVNPALLEQGKEGAA